MIYSNEFSKYSKVQKDTLSKLISFAERCPVLISIASDMEKVTITHTSSGIVYTFNWADYENVESKDFVAKVKETLVQRHYPRLFKVTDIERPYTAKEIVDGLIEGKHIDDFKNAFVSETKTEVFRIESVMLWQNKFILKEDIPNSKTSYIWKLHTSGAIFLTKYRSNGFESLEDASKYFFDNADLIKVITSKQD